MFTRHLFVIIAALFAAAVLSSCAVTTAGTEASSDTFANTTEVTTDATFSTSPQDDDEAQAARVMKFVKSNFSRLRSDMAVGEGEYLTTLAVLLSIDDANKEQFYELTKVNYNQLFVISETTAQELVANLHKEMTLAQI